MADLNLSHNPKIIVLNFLIISIDYQLLMIFTVDGDFGFMVAVQPFTFLAAFPAAISAAIHAILRQNPDSLAVLQIDLHLREVRSADGISVGRRADRIEAKG